MKTWSVDAQGVQPGVPGTVVSCADCDKFAVVLGRKDGTAGFTWYVPVHQNVMTTDGRILACSVFYTPSHLVSLTPPGRISSNSALVVLRAPLSTRVSVFPATDLRSITLKPGVVWALTPAGDVQFVALGYVGKVAVDYMLILDDGAIVLLADGRGALLALKNSGGNVRLDLAAAVCPHVEGQIGEVVE